MRYLVYPFLLLFSFTFTTLAQTGWQWGINHTHTQMSSGIDSWATAVDGAGNIFCSGYCGSNDTFFFGGIPFYNSGSSHEIVIVKADSSGVYQWAVGSHGGNCEVAPCSM